MDERLQQRFLVNPENEEEKSENAMMDELMKLYGASQGVGKADQEASYNTIIPTAEICIKTKSNSGEKIFLNLCTGDHIPSPRDITDVDLIAILESEDPSQFRVPMSLGEPHVEMDKTGKGCTAYDVVISIAFCEKIKTSNLFLGFFMSVIMEGLEHKYKVTLDRDWVKLKNKKCMGKLQEQHIRTESKPWIMEMEDSARNTTQQTKSKPLISEVQQAPKTELKKAPEPKYSLVQEPAEGHPEFIVAEIQLPNIKGANALTLDLGEDRIVLETRSRIYGLDIFLPYNLIQEDCGAQFDKKAKTLTITMPIQPVIHRTIS